MFCLAFHCVVLVFDFKVEILYRFYYVLLEMYWFYIGFHRCPMKFVGFLVFELVPALTLQDTSLSF